MENFFQYPLIDIKNFDLLVSELIGAALIFILWFVFIFIGLKLFRRGKFSKQIGEKHVKASKRFYFIFISFLAIFGILKVIGIQTEKVLSATVFHTENVDILVYHFIVLYFIMTGTRFVVALIESIMLRYEKKQQVEKGKSRSVFLIIKYIIYILAITIFIQSIGFSITFVIASVSALLVGIGLGIQHFFNDIISGIVILFDHSIKIGDIVEIEGEIVGEVIETSLRTSKLVTRDDIIMILPNSMFTSEKVINWSHNNRKSRFEIKVGVAYGSDVRLVEKILTEVAIDHPDVDTEPRPFVLFEDFGNSSLDFSLKFWSQKQFWIEPIRSEMRFEIDKRFRENNVSIPFPQQDVYIKQLPSDNEKR